ncbi:MarR family winged helix-turn-helix transcriptional regulator [Sinomonas susongensis]|uniref:MarR family winged helix-turn-helix transcriptional regulator n=1 Tax=Sinomonas susongensis TaxID=1324851 RepID=UPI001BB1634A|nr:MarR family transcriptional regulator [Sinomonas susongensis]
MNAAQPAPSIMYVVKQLESASRAALDELLRPAGVTALQYTALTVLERRPDMSQTDLARQSFVRVQSAADLVSALVRRGLVTRRKDPDGGRRLLLSLTAEGRAFLAEYVPQVLAIEDRMLEGLDPADRQAFVSVLRSCSDNLRAGLVQHR